LKRTWVYTGQALICVILGLILAGAVGTAILKRPFILVPIRSNSMYPLMQRGDAVFIRSVDGEKVTVGDIIIFRPEGGSFASEGLVMHRIVAGSPERGFITKGDANEYTDQESGGAPVVKPESVIARAITIGERPLRIRLLGYPSLWLEQYQKSPYALPAAVGAVALLLIVNELRSRGKRRRKKTTPAYVIYPAAGLAVCLILGAAQIAGSSFLTLNYEVSPAGRGVMMGSPVGVLQQGDAFTRELIEVGGKGFLPMVASVTSADPQFTFSKDLVVTKPRVTEKLSVTVHARKPGNYSSKVYVGMFLPTLPPVLIHRLAGLSYWLALAAVSLVPALPLLLWPLVDTRMRRTIARAVSRRLSRATQRILP